MNDERDEIQAALHEHFFEGMPEAYLNLLADHAECVSFPESAYIFRQDEPAQSFYVITRGRVALELAAPGGARVIDTVGPADVLGFSWLFEPHYWKFDGRCLQATTAVAVDGVTIRCEAQDHPDFGYQLLERFAGVMASRLQATRYRLLDIYE